LNPSWHVTFDASKHINMVVYIGSMDEWLYSENLELWVGDSLVPTENTKIGDTY